MMKNQMLIDTIKALKEASKESGKAIWKALAEELSNIISSGSKISLMIFMNG